VKIAIVGAGSTYTPELFEGLILRRGELAITEVALHDIDPGRLEPVAGFCCRMASNMGADFRIRHTLDLDDALFGATFVVVQIRVGGQEARHRDETVPVRHGRIGQETTGAGGFAKALRTIPAVLEIAERVRACAPGAWVINFTNPSGIITEVLLRHGRVQTVGLCNIPVEMRMEAAKALGVPPETVELDYAGLNHLGFVRRIRVSGQDVTDAVLAFFRGGSGPKNMPDIDFPPDLVGALGMIPSPYLRYYVAEDTVMSELRSRTLTRAQEVMDLERRLFDIYLDPETWRKPDLLDQRGGAWYSRVALDVMAGLISAIPRVEVVNCLNRGALPGLPDDTVVEIPARLSSHGVSPVSVDPLPDAAMGIVCHAKAYERLTIEAALGRSRAKALAALMANPLVRTIDAARGILGDLIANGDFDPVD
jgi:6-phospho-beta-glucosidase